MKQIIPNDKIKGFASIEKNTLEIWADEQYAYVSGLVRGVSNSAEFTIESPYECKEMQYSAGYDGSDQSYFQKASKSLRILPQSNTIEVINIADRSGVGHFACSCTKSIHIIEFRYKIK